MVTRPKVGKSVRISRCCVVPFLGGWKAWLVDVSKEMDQTGQDRTGGNNETESGQKQTESELCSAKQDWRFTTYVRKTFSGRRTTDERTLVFFSYIRIKNSIFLI